MWKLDKQTETSREYSNTVTGGKCKTEKVYTDREGNSWWGFTDLMALPYTRSFAATKIASLYSLGFTKDDIANHISSMKFILKAGNDSEKYEKAYANLLDFEAKANNATDPVKQMSSLVCVYYLLGEEVIDSFDNSTQMKKMELLEADFEMHAFFLRHQISTTENYMTRLQKLSQIASPKVVGE